MIRVKITLIATAIALVSPAKSEAEPRKLTLAEAVQMALHIDPLISEAHISDDRARLGVLRAQLDRGQLKVDGQLQELWNKVNIGGPPIPGAPGCSDIATPYPLCGQRLNLTA